MFRRREIFEIRKKVKATILRNDVETRVTKEIKSRVEIEMKIKKSLII